MTWWLYVRKYTPVLLIQSQCSFHIDASIMLFPASLASEILLL